MTRAAMTTDDKLADLGRPVPDHASGPTSVDAPLSGASHTPGPWGDGNEAICVKVDRERPWASTVFCKGHDGSEANALVAMMFGATVEEAVANALLTAAAPELLGAAESAANDYQTSASHHPDHVLISKEAFNGLVAAAAKARGLP